MIEQTRSRWLSIIQHPLARILVACTWLILLIVPVQSAVRRLPARHTLTVSTLSIAIVAFVAFAAYVAYVRLVERRSVPAELAVGGALPELGLGVLIGALMFVFVISVLWSLGHYSVTEVQSWRVAIPALRIAAIAAVTEELFFRGVLFRITEEWLGTWWALLASASVFGLLHLLNPGATLLAGVAIIIEAGVMLAAAYVVTRRLWLPIGIHFAWNFVQGGIFGVAISGSQVKGILKGQLTGPTLVSGGAFGVEASVFAIGLGIVTSACCLWIVRRKGNAPTPSWAR